MQQQGPRQVSWPMLPMMKRPPCTHHPSPRAREGDLHRHRSPQQEQASWHWHWHWPWMWPACLRVWGPMRLPRAWQDPSPSRQVWEGQPLPLRQAWRWSLGWAWTPPPSPRGARGGHQSRSPWSTNCRKGRRTNVRDRPPTWVRSEAGIQREGEASLYTQPSKSSTKDNERKCADSSTGARGRPSGGVAPQPLSSDRYSAPFPMLRIPTRGVVPRAFVWGRYNA